MNQWNIEKRLKVIKEEMMLLLTRLVKERDSNPRYQTEASFYNHLFHELDKFYKSIGSPRLEVIEAWGPPFSEDHNKMVSQILEDMNYLIKEIESILDELNEVANQVLLEEEAYVKRLLDINNHIDKVQSELSTFKDIYVFQDHFGTMKFFNVEGSQNAANLSTAEQIMTLRKTSETNYNEYAEVRIIAGNGFPGNTKVVNATGDGLSFEGQANLRTNLAEILDSNADTWFEFERFYITDHTNEVNEAKGFAYDENLKWADMSKEKLRLAVEIKFAKERLINWVSLLPYIPQSKGAIGGTIEKLVIEDSSGRYLGYGFEEKFNAQKAFMIGDVMCKRIVLYLRQDVPYQVNIGHPYFIKMPGGETTVMDIEELQQGVLVHGRYPSITNLEVSYDKGLQQVVYPTFAYGDTIKDEEQKKSNLFTMPNIAATGEAVVSGFNLEFAHRFALGIKDVQIKQNTFSVNSEYISYPFKLDKPVKEISLSGSHRIPENFPNGEWVKYYISVDSGKSWHRIYDQISDRSDAKVKYLVNSGTPAESQIVEVGYIEMGADITDVLVKIEISRPDGNEYNKFSPVVYGYNLEVLA